jgi:AcrR family transcriptional regulator
VNEPEASPRRLTRAEAKAQTRQRLLDSAARVFADKGFGGATLEEIAESAGYSTGAMYANFGGKEQLFLEVVAAHRARAAAARIGQVTQIFDEALADGSDPFDALTGMFVKAADRDRELAPLQAEFWLYAVRNPAAKQVIADSLSGQVDELEPVVARALRHFGAPRDAAPREVTVVLLALFQGLARRRRLDPAAVRDDLLARALRWLFGGLRAEQHADGTPGRGGDGQESEQEGDETR